MILLFAERLGISSCKELNTDAWAFPAAGKFPGASQIPGAKKSKASFRNDVQDISWAIEVIPLPVQPKSILQWSGSADNLLQAPSSFHSQGMYGRLS